MGKKRALNRWLLDGLIPIRENYLVYVFCGFFAQSLKPVKGYKKYNIFRYVVQILHLTNSAALSVFHSVHNTVQVQLVHRKTNRLQLKSLIY